MGMYGGLVPEDWKKWGQFTTLKINAAELAERTMAPEQVIYCSPLVDPYQPAERVRPLMPSLLAAVFRNPPRVFAIQTRAPLILRDMPLLKQKLATVTKLAAQLRYGTISELERRLAAEEEHLATKQGETRLLREVVTADEIAEIVSAWTGIPVSRLQEGEREKLLGWTRSCAAGGRPGRGGPSWSPTRSSGHGPASGTRAGRSARSSSSAPPASARPSWPRPWPRLFDSEDNMVRLDMSEYQERHTVSRLLGAPPATSATRRAAS